MAADPMYAGTGAGPVAAIDCGSNSTRLLVTDAVGGELSRLMRITRLGQGVDRNNRLAPEAIARTVAVLAEFRGVIDAVGVRRVRVVATSAVRDADNGQAFTDAVKATLGVEPEVLSGTAEGELAFAGAAGDLTPFGGDTVVVDIGGGSTELIVQDGQRLAAVSLQLGCVRLSERFLRGDPPTPAEMTAARGAVRDELAQAERHVPVLGSLSPSRRLIGLAGTVSTLATLHLGLSDYDFDLLHHAVMTRAAVTEWCRRLAALRIEERKVMRGMVPGREDVIVGGAVVLDEVMSRFAFDVVTVSERDILDGIAMSLRTES